MNCREWEERVALYAGGDAATTEAAEIEQHMAGCPGCRQFLSSLRESLETVRAEHREPIEEAHFAAVRARVMAQIGRPRFAWWKIWGLAAAAAAAVLLAAVLVAPSRHRRLEPVAVVRPVPPARIAPPPVPPVKSLVVLSRDHPARRGPAEAVNELRMPPEPENPVIIHMVTDNPDVVIYWIADAKGDQR